MLKPFITWFHVKYSCLAALLYSIPVLIFIYNATYTDAWLLYLGNGLFLCTLSLFMLSYNRKKYENASAMFMLVSGHVTTLAGVFIACLICFIFLVLLVPGLLHPGIAGKVLTKAPVSSVDDKTNGLNFMVFVNAIIGNVSAGSFASIIFAFTVKRDQTKASGVSTVKNT